MDKVEKSDSEWREQLSPEQYEILRNKGTEPAFSGKYCDEKAQGAYVCAGCGAELFSSETKFDSGTGWPSFWQPVHPESVAMHEDRGHGMVRKEVVCAICDSHLGHIFDDGPPPTGLRYCLNSASLGLKKK
ncbi:MAG: peptide-methionine (R)-S-oxide reductase MsrB [Proteobacteria bacterium]|nr:peptide-methionine (R)-S-oxide reductase MsrB [Pseudomonadota bacterium]